MSVLGKGEFVSNDGLSEIVSGKTIKNISMYSDSMDDYLAFIFVDGTSLHIKYDWLYDWQLIDHERKIE